MQQGTVFNIQRFSTHDGPGIRTTVFLKGCPLDCWWCHNPESKGDRPVVFFHEAKCLGCGACSAVCPQGAMTLSRGGPCFDEARCNLCGKCHKRCPAEAVELVGKVMSSQDVLAEAVKDKVFYDESGGGVTFSGGEPLLQAEFLRELLVECRDRGLHTAVDTSGYAPWPVLAEIAATADMFLYDLKHVESTMHERFTGVPNKLILENLRRLSLSHPEIILRVPVVPGVNDAMENILATGSLAVELGLSRVDLLPYHSIGRDKYLRLGEKYRVANVAVPSAEQIELIAMRLRSLGLIVKIGG